MPNKRLRKKLAELPLYLTVLLISAMALSLTSCSKKLSRYEAEFLKLFDTSTKIIGYAENKKEFEEFSQLIYDNLYEYHKLFDIYNDYEGISNIKTINDNAGIKPVNVDKRIIDLLKFSREIYEETGGKVNVAKGSVLKIWHDFRTEGINNPKEAELPPMDILIKASEHTNIERLIIDEENMTVFLEDEEMSLDVGAIAKGYAVERVAKIAEEKGYSSALISVGGNIRAIGGKDGNAPWKVGVQNPDTKSSKSEIYKTNLKDLSLVTSGKYIRYYTVEGVQYHHIINPDTLMPADFFAAVTVVCKDSGYADALSTALFNMSYEEGIRFISKIPDAEALWVLNSGEIKFSENFESIVGGV